ncbi:DUF1926 domain-containing protein, partial [bacterium]|nr:DUF1926 domain-containing protein [bacterium]
MKKINFLFGIHCHQPVGNFDHVFRESFQLCYEPFLDVLSRHPGVRCALHYTGPLLEWIEQNRPEYFDKIRMLVDRNQVEMLTGGFYEPILSILPDQDAHDQIVYMSNYTRKYFHYAPKGMWLAERVWEPGLPSLLNNAGVEYSLLDDSHFLATGMKQNEMFGYYITENKGTTLNLFPINKNLRYLIPFKQPEDTIEYFRSIASDDHSKAVTMGDDGEKFGVWPNTYDWVYKQGYLERLFTLLEENSSWISMVTFSEYIKENPPRERIYLPTSSYEEMLEWSLPARAIPQYEHTIHEMKKCPSFDDMKPFIRGGFWRNFLSKYHESNLMHKKMLRVSKLVHTYAEKELAVKKELWRGQCNCAYWHGLFGGTYLNYLRNAIYTHLIKAETMVDAIVKKENSSECRGIETYDYMCDGQEKVLISSPVLNIYIDPAHSGSCFELDYKPAFFNVANTFSRKYEAYHDKLLSMHKNEQNSADKEQPASIHDMVVSKEDGLENYLQYDTYFRHLFVDHFLAQDTTLEEFKDGEKSIDT